MRAAAAIVALGLLAGCAASSAPPPALEVKVPVPVACLAADQVPQRPVLAGDEQLAGMTDYALVLSLAADRRARQAYELKLEAAIAACVARPP
jgi:hypothetical protein